MIVSTFFSAIANIIHMLISAYIWVIIISAILSWFRFQLPDSLMQIAVALERITSPAYNLVRKFIPTIVGNVDLAPIIVLVILQFIDLFFVRLLGQLAFSL